MKNYSASSSHYYGQLDGLRALAIALVILFHWFSEDSFFGIFSFGPLGVTLFFVLSGFLITNVLLKQRAQKEENGVGKLFISFSTRRALRIFPLYYIVLLLVWTVQFIPWFPKVHTLLYSHSTYYLSYTSNFLIYQTADWSDILSIYWTLAVEEQFYLIWPFFILLCPQKHLNTGIAMMIALSFVARLVLLPDNPNASVLLPTCVDSFAMGAWWSIRIAFAPPSKGTSDLAAFLGSIGAAVFVILCLMPDDSLVKIVLFKTAMSILSLALIMRATTGRGFSSAPGGFLDSFPVRFVGKISYGMYIFHMLVPQLLLPAIIKLAKIVLNLDIVFSEGQYRIACLLMLLLLATLTRLLIEQPLLLLREKFKDLAMSA